MDLRDSYAIKCSKGYVEYVEHYEGNREYGFTFEIKFAKKYKNELSVNRALREFKKITGLDAVRVKVI